MWEAAQSVALKTYNFFVISPHFFVAKSQLTIINNMLFYFNLTSGKIVCACVSSV